MKLQALKDLAIEIYPKSEQLFASAKTHGEVQAMVRALNFATIRAATPAYSGGTCPIEAPKPDPLFDVFLISNGPNHRVGVIKAIRELTGAWLKDAKDMTDLVMAGGVVKLVGNRTQDEAEHYRRVIEEAGGRVSILEAK